MSHPFGSKMPRRRVPCQDCGKLLLRASHFAVARCKRCLFTFHKRNYGTRIKDLRSQARRYRIVLHVLGYGPDQFDEMLAEMRASPMAFRCRPETREARFDLRKERKCRSAA